MKISSNKTAAKLLLFQQNASQKHCEINKEVITSLRELSYQEMSTRIKLLLPHKGIEWALNSINL